MIKNLSSKLKTLWPYFLSCFLLFVIVVSVVPDFSLVHFFLFICTLTLGYLVGNLNTLAVRFREKKVKKQSLDLIKLRERIKIQTAAMESAANGIIITDTKGIIQWVNPGFSKLTGYSVDESIGSSFKMLSSGEHDKKFFQNLWTTILSGKVWHDEIVNRRKNGKLYTEEMTITPVLDSKKKITNFVAIKQDISERKRLEKISAIERKRIATELDVARDIQISMLQHSFPPFPKRKEVDIYAKLIPAREVGGDFYDFFWIDEERLCFMVGDVSGKGVPAALMMAVTKTLLKSGALLEKSAARTLTMVNKEISKDNDNNMFITVFMGVLNTATGYLTYSNAGHNITYVIDHLGNKVNPLGELHGVVIGALEETVYKETVIRLNRGDVIFAYTDGVTEARDKENQLFSNEHLQSILEHHDFISARELIDEVFVEVRKHEKGAEPADDITALFINFREKDEDSLLDNLSTTIINRIDNIQIFLKQFGEFAKKHNISLEIIQQLNIVFDELLSNTISYAYNDEKEHEIEIIVWCYTDKLSVTLMDDGMPYNPFDMTDPDTSLSVEDRDLGGLGVHLVKFLVDKYSYEYKDQICKNSTHFIKLID